MADQLSAVDTGIHGASNHEPTLLPMSPEFLADPHGVYTQLRPADLVRDPIGWSAISYAACDAAFKDTAMSPGIDPLLEQLGIGGLWGEPGRTLTDSEGADHQRLRRVVSPWFTARRIEALRQRTADLVDSALDAAGSSGDPDQIDVMADLADVVPALLFCWMIGAPEDDSPILARWSKALLSVFTARPEMVEPVRAAKAELAEYTRTLLAQKRADPGDDLATMLAQGAAAGAIDEVDAFHLLEELLSASVDNTANTAGLAAYTLANRPEQWSAVHERPSLVAGAVEECGRFEPAIRHTIKYAWSDTELLGTPIPAGSFVTLRIAAAHRDPVVYAEPTWSTSGASSRPRCSRSVRVVTTAWARRSVGWSCRKCSAVSSVGGRERGSVRVSRCRSPRPVMS